MAQKQLKTWLEKNGRSAAWLAKRLGMSRSVVSYWLTGSRTPEMWTRERIESVTGVPASGWESGPERKARKEREKRERVAARLSA
jgi:transcriptional regulator with XRE-family HTH domain